MPVHFHLLLSTPCYTVHFTTSPEIPGLEKELTILGHHFFWLCASIHTARLSSFLLTAHGFYLPQEEVFASMMQ
jgi:hypothetical protein